MKKSTIVIIIISTVLVLGVLTAGGIMLLNTLGSMMDNLPDDFVTDEGPEDETETAIGEAVDTISGKHNAPYWVNSIKTGYSYETAEIFRGFHNKPVTFTGTLSDIVFEDRKYIALFRDRNTDIYSSVVYGIECTEEQKTSITENKEDDVTYFIYTVAITPSEVITTPLDDDDTWAPPIIVRGSLLGFETTPASYEYY